MKDNTTKTTKMPTILIKGKEYVQVKDRILYFNENYPNGKIETKIVSYKDKQIIMKAKVTPDIAKPERYFVDYSQAKENQGMVNAQAAMENASTSAVGRALALMGIGVIDSVASADEMKKVFNKPLKKEPILKEEFKERLCSNKTCGQAIPENVYKYSISKFGKALCYECQKKENK